MPVELLVGILAGAFGSFAFGWAAGLHHARRTSVPEVVDATTAYQRGFADGDAQARQNVAEWVRNNPDSMDAWADANRQATAQRLAPVGDDAVEDGRAQTREPPHGET